MRRAFLILVLSLFSSIGWAGDPEPETTRMPYGSPQLPESCRQFWDQILAAPIAPIVGGTRVSYPTTGECREVPPAFRFYHEKYLKLCEPTATASKRSTMELLDCGQRTAQYRIALRAWKHRDLKNLTKLPEPAAWEMLIHLASYSSQESLPRYKVALALANHLSESHPSNIEVFHLKLVVLFELATLEKSFSGRSKDIRSTSQILLRLLQKRKYYPHKSMGRIGRHYLQSMVYLMEKIGKGAEVRQLLSNHPRTKGMAQFYDACDKTGQARLKILTEGLADPYWGPLFANVISGSAPLHCGRTLPTVPRPALTLAFAQGINLPWDAFES